MHGYPGQSPLTARPLGRGREEALEAPGGGGGLPHTEKDCLVETQETGGGEVDVNRSSRDAGGRGGAGLNKGRIPGDV